MARKSSTTERQIIVVNPTPLDDDEADSERKNRADVDVAGLVVDRRVLAGFVRVGSMDFGHGQCARLRASCGDCRELQTFVLDPVERTHRFRLRKDRRRHLHEQTQRHGLDMTHETERRGSPQTLVCTKTRRTYVRQCAEYKADVTAMSTLLRVMGKPAGELATLATRMADTTGSTLKSG